MRSPTLPPLAFEPEHDSPKAVRERILGQLSRALAVLIAPLVLLTALVELVRGHGSPLVYSYGAAQLIAVAGAWAGRRQRPRVQGLLLIGYAYVSLLLSALHFGPALGMGIVTVTAAVWGGLMYGRRGSLGAAAIAALTILALGLLVHLGWAHPKIEALEVGSPLNWIRLTLVAVAGAIGIGWLVIRLLGEYQAGIDRAGLALSRAREERHKTEHAVRALLQSQRTESLHRLAGGVGHEINNALAVVLCNAELLLESDDPLEVELAQEILEAAQNASKTSRHLMTLEGTGTTARGVCHADEVLARLEKLLRRTLPKEIETRIEDHSRGRLSMSSEALERCLLNLALNARDAMPEGGVLTIRVTPLVDGPRARGHRIDVSDSGSGIPESVRTQIFEPFFTTKPPGSGSGLGLSTVRELVHSCDGGLRVDSCPEKGSCFTIELGPATQWDAERARTQRPLTRPRGLHVLLVDDDAHVRRVMHRILSREGYLVTESVDGNEALSRVHGDAFDAMIVDGVLPGNDSSEVIAQFRRAHPKAKVIVCSGHSEQVLRERGLELDSCERLAKPFARHELLRALAADLK